MTKETYLRSVDTLLDSYNNGTLFRGDCNKCAVGSLLGTAVWGVDFCSGRDQSLQEGITLAQYDPDRMLWGGACRKSFEELGIYDEKALRKYLDTFYKDFGYTRTELALIEKVFEKKGKTEIEGLRAVLTTMAEMVEEPVDNQKSQTRLETIYQSKYAAQS